MLISPTEPKIFRDLGTTSSLPEKYGADFLFTTESGLLGVQRKEFSDLIASTFDGRLGKELVQLQSLPNKLLIVEGQPSWATNGNLLGRVNFTRTAFQSLMWSVQSNGCWVSYTNNSAETIELLLRYPEWLKKHSAQGSSLLTRNSKPKGEWGVASNRDWGIHLLIGFGIGPKTAANIYDYFGGVPLKWDVSVEELMKVNGVGKARAGKLVRSLMRGIES